MSGFNHTSMGSQRDMLLLLGEMIQKEVIAAVTGPFGIMVDDMTDIANLEQMLGFIQYYSKSSEKVEVKFLCLENVLANSDKADSETITGVLLKVIEKHGLNFTWFKSFVSDGASVMVGERSGVATRLKADERTFLLEFLFVRVMSFMWSCTFKKIDVFLLELSSNRQRVLSVFCTCFIVKRSLKVSVHARASLWQTQWTDTKDWPRSWKRHAKHAGCHLTALFSLHGKAFLPLFNFFSSQPRVAANLDGASGPFVPLLRKKFSKARVAYSPNHTAFNWVEVTLVQSSDTHPQPGLDKQSDSRQ